MKGGIGGVRSTRHSWGRAIDGLCTTTANPKDVATCRAAGDALLVSRMESGEMCTSSARLSSTWAGPPSSSSSLSGCHSARLCPPASPSPSPSIRTPSRSSSSSSLSFSSVRHRRTWPTSKTSGCAGVRPTDWPTRGHHRSRSNHLAAHVIEHGWSQKLSMASPAGVVGATVVVYDNDVATRDTFPAVVATRDTLFPAIVGRDTGQRMGGTDEEEASLNHLVIERAQGAMHVPIPLLPIESLSSSANSPDSEEEKPGRCPGMGAIERSARPVAGDAIPLLSSFSSSSSSSSSSAAAAATSSLLLAPSSWQSTSRESACYGVGGSGRGGGGTRGRGCGRELLSGSLSLGPCELAGKPLPRRGVRRAEASWWWWSSSALPMVVSVEAMGRGPDGAPEGPGGEKRDGQRPSEDKSVPTERLKDLKFRPIVEGRGEWATDQLITARNDQLDSNLISLGVCSRVLYSLGMYGGLALVGNVLCTISGVDFWGGFDFNPDDFLTGLLYAGPLVALQYVMRQEAVVKKCPVARALDDDIAEYFAGMSMPQLILVVIASSTAEEFFFRSAVQGGISHALQVTGRGVTETTYGMAALT
ncbi:hypothetical protein CBR_g19263 [Chara braunii]|uniref:Uncharacterized protein n=1 Tax=Chara braunii TaxID=69332 RepID=A0A388JTU5_CHABU|nr:hypothetical protein CBR_g19263 [Chara braunii]|eukprot:GBG61187.1 hypothetical protein CBR_g19263 [Chara braunii]